MEVLTASTYVYVLSDKEHTSDTIITIIDRLIASIDSDWLQADVEATIEVSFLHLLCYFTHSSWRWYKQPHSETIS